MRAFIAMDLDDQKVRTSIGAFQEQIESTRADLKIVDPSKLHFTLLFLGEISEEEAFMIMERLSKIRLPNFEVEFTGTGTFPSPHRVNVIWIGVDADSQTKLKKVADGVVSSLSGLRFKPDKQFEPHLTVARVKSGREREKLLEVIGNNAGKKFGTQLFTEIKLKKSDLTGSGPIYTDLQRFKLGE